MPELKCPQKQKTENKPFTPKQEQNGEIGLCKKPVREIRLAHSVAVNT